MNPYPDTGFLCSVYSNDANSSWAIAVMQRINSPMVLTWLHHLEFRNALRLRIFRNEISTKQRDASLELLLTDLASGVFMPISPALDAITVEAERLSAAHVEKIGTRSLDILHVAMAIIVGTSEFITTDKRQASLARTAGIRVTNF